MINATLKSSPVLLAPEFDNNLKLEADVKADFFLLQQDNNEVHHQAIFI